MFAELLKWKIWGNHFQDKRIVKKLKLSDTQIENVNKTITPVNVALMTMSNRVKLITTKKFNDMSTDQKIQFWVLSNALPGNIKSDDKQMVQDAIDMMNMAIHADSKYTSKFKKLLAKLTKE